MDPRIQGAARFVNQQIGFAQPTHKNPLVQGVMRAAKFGNPYTVRNLGEAQVERLAGEVFGPDSPITKLISNYAWGPHIGTVLTVMDPLPAGPTDEEERRRIEEFIRRYPNR